ncbi:redoxin domain-containing protein [Candidatus Woesearchaeota archaeon]|nr:redoxin domain-containing protein [Candidatus Woesearchaeota archaeon]
MAPIKRSRSIQNRYKNYILLGLLFAIILSIFFIQKLKVQQGNTTVTELSVKDSSERVEDKAGQYSRAVELVNPDGYINTGDKPITIAEHIGKDVILVDFWTYSCINCQRTLPYLTAWHEKYGDKGLVIIGIHTPEFDFEKDYDNVKRAVEKFGIKYPVVQDNNYQTWRAYQNRYWPHKYLIDIDGFIVYDHIGEGAYEETERKIQELLEERNTVLRMKEEISKDIAQPEAEKPGAIGTPEIYFGYGFSRNQMGNAEGWQPGKTVAYMIPDKAQPNKFYLQGEWLNNKDNMELKSQGAILLAYFAKNVNLVAGAEEPVEITVLLDGEEYRKLTVSDFDLYNIVSMNESNTHVLEIVASKPGLMAYTFTFG